MTPKGKPGTGLATGAARVKQMSAAKKRKQANGANPAGYTRKKPKAARAKAAAPVRGGTRSKKGASDQVPGKTNYSY